MDIIKNLKKRYNNFIICMKYPFFWPRNVWTGKKCSGFFSFTELDHLPKGWYKAFGLQMAKEIQECLNKFHKLYLIENRNKIKKNFIYLFDNILMIFKNLFILNFDKVEFLCIDTLKLINVLYHLIFKKHSKNLIRITQLKEKYGRLCIYTTYTFSELDKIISKYERLSEITCSICGKIATHISIGYILPYCHDCKLQNKGIKYKKITKSIRKIIKIYACE